MMVVQPPKRVEHNKEKVLSKWVIVDICTLNNDTGDVNLKIVQRRVCLNRLMWVRRFPSWYRCAVLTYWAYSLSGNGADRKRSNGHPCWSSHSTRTVVEAVRLKNKNWLTWGAVFFTLMGEWKWLFVNGCECNYRDRMLNFSGIHPAVSSHTHTTHTHTHTHTHTPHTTHTHTNTPHTPRAHTHTKFRLTQRLIITPQLLYNRLLTRDTIRSYSFIITYIFCSIVL
jgi:hypothetical protein